jgi:hypothetical protein
MVKMYAMSLGYSDSAVIKSSRSMPSKVQGSQAEPAPAGKGNTMNLHWQDWRIHRRKRIATSEAQGKGKPKGGNFPTELSG